LKPEEKKGKGWTREQDIQGKKSHLLYTKGSVSSSHQKNKKNQKKARGRVRLEVTVRSRKARISAKAPAAIQRVPDKKRGRRS